MLHSCAIASVVTLLSLGKWLAMAWRWSSMLAGVGIGWVAGWLTAVYLSTTTLWPKQGSLRVWDANAVDVIHLGWGDKSVALSYHGAVETLLREASRSVILPLLQFGHPETCEPLTYLFHYVFGSVE